MISNEDVQANKKMNPDLLRAIAAIIEEIVK
jgi:hypothetical protein